MGERLDDALPHPSISKICVFDDWAFIWGLMVLLTSGILIAGLRCACIEAVPVATIGAGAWGALIFRIRWVHALVSSWPRANAIVARRHLQVGARLINTSDAVEFVYEYEGSEHRGRQVFPLYTRLLRPDLDAGRGIWVSVHPVYSARTYIGQAVC